jgi:hypothetical protein
LSLNAYRSRARVSALRGGSPRLVRRFPAPLVILSFPALREHEVR